jgi:hypothetical protein
MASIVVGLGSEVTAFEFANRFLATVGVRFPRPLASGGETPPLQNQSPITGHPSPNLWSWYGPGGWREGLISSALSFGLLRGSGWFARDQNIVLQHGLQSSSMVAGHHLAWILAGTTKPAGSLAEQLVQAESTNLQMAAGMSLMHGLGPQIQTWGRLEPSWRQRPLEIFRRFPAEKTTLAFAEGEGTRFPSQVFMSSGDGRGDGKDPTKNPEGLSGTREDGIDIHSHEVPPELAVDAKTVSEHSRAHSIYKAIPIEAQEMVRLNLVVHSQVYESIKEKPLELLGISIAETLNGINNLLSYHESELSPENALELQAARSWILGEFENSLSDPGREKLKVAYRQAVSSFSLLWIHEDISKLILSPLRIRALQMLERVPDHGPLDPNLPAFLQEVGRFMGGMHRDGTLAILAFGQEQGWISWEEENFPKEQVSAFRVDYRLRYPGGIPPIRQDFIDIFFGTGTIISGLREKWGSQHPFLEGFDESFQVLGLEPEAVFQRSLWVQRVKKQLMGGNPQN